MDIVERLRNGTGNNPENHWLLIEAADEIERLWGAAKDRPKDRPNEAADEIERLREALNKIANGQRNADLSYMQLYMKMKMDARAALKEGK
jgi:hypothetical protein